MNGHHVTQANRTNVQADSEGDVCHQTFKPGLGWTGRSRCRYAQSERRLHDKKRYQQSSDAEEQGRQQGWPRKPVSRNNGDEDERVSDTNDVMSDPADCALEVLLRRIGDIRMHELSGH